MSYCCNKKMSYNSQQVKMSPIKMTFRDYYLAFVELNEPYLANGWGWFVDIELDYEPIKNLPNNNRYKTSQNVSIPKTIQEYPSIRSMKSMRNLHDTSMMFEMDDVYDDKHRTNKHFGSIITHSVGLITLIFVYFITSF